MTIQHTVVIFRKSTNTNSFGLRGYWAIEKNPGRFEGEHKARLRVWEFASNKDLKRGEQWMAFFLNSIDEPSSPVHELVTCKGSLPPEKLEEFLAQFNL